MGFPGVSDSSLSAMQETQIQSLGREDPPEKGEPGDHLWGHLLVGSQLWTTCLTCVITFNPQQFSEVAVILLALQRRRLRCGEVKPIFQGTSVSKKGE